MATGIGSLNKIDLFNDGKIPPNYAVRQSYERVWEYGYEDSSLETERRRYVDTLVLAVECSRIASSNGTGFDDLRQVTTISSPSCVPTYGEQRTSYYDVYPGTWRVDRISANDEPGKTVVTISLNQVGSWEIVA